MGHELETGRDWVRIDRAAILGARDRSTLYRWIAKGYLRSQKARGKTFVSVKDLIETEAAYAAGETPATRGNASVN